MFDAFYYCIYTQVAIVMSLLVLVVLITILCVTKRKIKVMDCIIVIVCLIGLYFAIPYYFFVIGLSLGNMNFIEKAAKLSINPYEKRLCYSAISDLYSNPYGLHEEKDGNKAIEYKEKAINGEYEKYRAEVGLLLLWYSTKGDVDKVMELSKYSSGTWALFKIYIMNNEYDKAIKLYEDNPTVNLDKFLLADLYRITGDVEKAKLIKEQAQKEYEKQLASYQTDKDRQKYIEYSVKNMSVKAYKNWIMEQQKEYKFVK